MGRPPSNGGPPFRFNGSEVSEMETILQDHNNMMPSQEVLVALADKFSNSPDRQGKFVVQTKQIWNWFQNKRYAIRARTSKIPTKSNVSSMQPVAAGVPMQSAQVVSTMPAAQAKTAVHIAPSAPVLSREDNLSSSRLPHSVTDAAGRMSADNSQLEFEARSARDGAWYDVASFLSLRNLEAGYPEVLVRFAGFGPEEDEWINVMTHIRHRSLPCESSECVAVLPGDLILCFQEGKEQALYFDAHVLDAQRRRHDARGCRCRFLVRYDHDQCEEIVPLRKICRRPETDYRLQQLHAMNDSSAEHKQSASSADHMKSAPAKEQHKIVSSVEQIKTDVDTSSSKEGLSNPVTLSVQTPPAPISLGNTSSLSEAPNGAAYCSTDKTTGDITTASSNTQLSRPEVINLDPETEVENTNNEVKDPTDDIAVDEPLDKATYSTPDATAETSFPADKTVCTPMCETDSTVAQDEMQELISQAPPAVATELAPNDGQVDPEPMMGETSMLSDDGKANRDHSKDEPIGSTDVDITQEYVIPISNIPSDAGLNEAVVDVSEMTSSVDNVTLEPTILEKSAAASTEAGNTDINSSNAPPSDTRDGTDHPVDHSGSSTPPITYANMETCVEKNDDPI